MITIYKILTCALLFWYIPLCQALNIRNINRCDEVLYDTHEPFASGYLRVSAKHEIYYEQYGNPDGIPVLFLHGGPGAGCSSATSAYFDPERFHLIMFDQRGAMRSRPFGCMDDNTPQASMQDIEALRKHLNINRWFVVGGSYGSMLGMLYGQTHPHAVLGFVLRGICCGTKPEHEHLLFGMSKFRPEAYRAMLAYIPTDEHDQLLSAMYKRLMDDDPAVHLPLARAFLYYDVLCALPAHQAVFFLPDRINNERAVSITRAFLHYAMHDYFLSPNQLLSDIPKIAHIPAILLNGRNDLICPPEMAYRVHERWPSSELWYMTNAGHKAAGSDLAGATKRAIEQLAQDISWPLS